MKFSELSEYLSRLETTSSRIEITKILADLFSKSSSDEIEKIVNLVLGRLAPSYKGIVFNLADKLVLQAVARAYEMDLENTKKIYREVGDLGIVAQKLAESKKARDKGLDVLTVYEVMLSIAKKHGEGSVEQRISELSLLLQSSGSLEARFITRIPIGKLRLGFSDKTVIDALSWMETGGKERKKELEKAYEVLPDIGLLAKKVKEKGSANLSKAINPVVGVPVMPMLCQRIKSTQEMVDKMGEVSVEPKFDGVRVSIHFERGKKVKAFTRNLNDVSEMFPELETLANFTKASNLILDAEGMGVDPKKKALLDFQTTMQRRRKHDIGEIANKIPLHFYVFDILLKNGKNLMGEAYIERKKELQKTIDESGSFKLTPYKVTTEASLIRELHDQYLKQGLEGVIVKKTSNGYIPGRTGYHWVKMKESEDSRGKLSDTVDCVIIGFTQGQGKRVSFGVGQFLAGIVDSSGSDLVIKTITKVGTGLSDEQFIELKSRLEPLIIKEKPDNYEVHKDLTPDFWVKPQIVVELAADDLTVSPKHTAGYALRFPRLVKFRDDKSADQATTLKEIGKLYKMQKDR